MLRNIPIIDVTDKKPVITESKSYNALNKPVTHRYIGGIFSIAEKLNRNRRWYPYDILSEAVNKYVSETGIGNQLSSAYGEIMHPDYLEPNMRKAAIIVTEYAETESGIWTGKAKILNTPDGKILQTIIDDGGAFGVSTRGYGDIKEGHDKNIVTSIDLTAVDVVPQPSVAEAMMEHISESRYVNEGLLRKRLNCEILECAGKIVKGTHIKEQRERQLLELTLKLFGMNK
jgi:hypothetical protein